MYNKPILTIFGQNIYLYGICIAVGILACLVVFYVYTSKKNMPSEVQDFAFFVAIIAIAFGFLAAKFGQAVYDWIANGFKNFDFFNAGITVMVGLIGGAAAFILIYFVGGNIYFKGAKKGIHIREFNKILLVAPCCITIAHAFGRIGCLFAGCCHGLKLGDSYVFGGVYMNTPAKGSGYFIPTQLYEALFLFALFAVLSVLFFKRSNILMQIYLIAYGVWRFFIEFFRSDYVGGANTFSLRPSQWQSFVFVFGGLALLIVYEVLKLPFKLPPEPIAETDKIEKEEILSEDNEDQSLSDSVDNENISGSEPEKNEKLKKTTVRKTKNNK